MLYRLMPGATGCPPRDMSPHPSTCRTRRRPGMACNARLMSAPNQPAGRLISALNLEKTGRYIDTVNRERRSARGGKENDEDIDPQVRRE